LQTELDKQRTKVLEEYNKEMSTINKISGGATSMAEERKYNNERKIREKANRMRSTGKLPHTRACFWEEFYAIKIGSTLTTWFEGCMRHKISMHCIVLYWNICTRGFTIHIIPIGAGNGINTW
jgi:hypothetical protein